MLPPLTDPAAVVAAMQEYDELGADAFLEKYKFGRAVSYYLEYEGRRYDSKAIAGAAFAHQFPGERWSNQYFHGGLPIVRLLGRLGFTVTSSDAPDTRLGIEIVGLEQNLVAEFEQAPLVGTVVARRREASLVDDYSAHLRGLGHDLGRHRIPISGGGQLATDLFDRSDNVLYEAKSGVDRSTIRLGLGQMLDYRRLLDAEDLRYRLLLPSRPLDELVELLACYDVGVTWPDDDLWRDEPPSSLDLAPEAR